MERTLENYFSHLNSLSLKIGRDVNKVKSTYNQETWHSLTLAEQEMVLNNHFIKPNIYMKYNNQTNSEKTIQKVFKTQMVYSYNGQDLHTYIHQNVGMKILHDENNARNCMDEHSFPFCYRTKSQINISGLESIAVVKPSIDLSKSLKSFISKSPPNNTKKISIINITKAPHYKSDIEYSTNCVREHEIDQQSNISSQFLFKCDGSSNSISTDCSTVDNDFKEDIGHEEKVKLLSPELQIPKGFDFLSNW